NCIKEASSIACAGRKTYNLGGLQDFLRRLLPGKSPEDGALVRFAQWMIGLAMVAASGVATVLLLAPGEADQLRKANETLAREKFQLQQAIERLTAESRVAEIYVVDQVRAGELVEGKPAETDLTTLDFIEIDREGHPLPSRRVTVKGTTPRFEGLVIMFDHEHVAMGDALRGK